MGRGHGRGGGRVPREYADVLPFPPRLRPSLDTGATPSSEGGLFGMSVGGYVYGVVCVAWCGTGAINFWLEPFV